MKQTVAYLRRPDRDRRVIAFATARNPVPVLNREGVIGVAEVTVEGDVVFADPEWKVGPEPDWKLWCLTPYLADATVQYTTDGTGWQMSGVIVSLQLTPRSRWPWECDCNCHESASPDVQAECACRTWEGS